MNRVLIPFAAVSLLTGQTVAYADDLADVYGRLHFKILEQHGKDIRIINSGHRLGVKGSTKLDSGNTGFYKLETEYGNDQSGKGTSTRSSADAAELSVRHAYLGMETNVGTFTVGRMNNPMNSTYLADMFEHNSGWYEQTKFRIGNTLLYNTKSFGPASFFASITAEGQGTDGEQEDADAYVIGAKTKIAGFNIVLAYMKDEVEVSSDSTSIAVAVDPATGIGTGSSTTTTTLTEREFKDISLGISYSSGPWYVGLNLERSTNTDPVTGDDTEVSVVDTALLYSMKSVTYGIGYATADTDLDVGNDPDRPFRLLAGAYVNLGGSADAYVELGHFHDSDDPNNIALGYRITF